MIILGPVAISKNNVIGKNNDLPWHLPEDLKHFKELTFGKTVLMGRKTFESIVARLGKPLPGRKNIVISRQGNLNVPEGVLVFKSIEDAFQELPNEDIYVIGGAEIYKMALPMAKQMLVTHVAGEYEGDVFFPEINWGEWRKIEEEKHEGFTFAKYERVI